MLSASNFPMSSRHQPRDTIVHRLVGSSTNRGLISLTLCPLHLDSSNSWWQPLTISLSGLCSNIGCHSNSSMTMEPSSQIKDLNIFVFNLGVSQLFTLAEHLQTNRLVKAANKSSSQGQRKGLKRKKDNGPKSSYSSYGPTTS